MASIKIILLEDVESLGLAGTEVNVANGYARNYLFPKQLATKATPAALRILASRKEKIEAQRKADLEKHQTMAEKINEMTLTIPMQASEDGQLFGSVTPRMVADGMAENGIEIETQRIKLEDHIRELGEFDIEVKITSDISANLKLSVTRSA